MLGEFLHNLAHIFVDMAPYMLLSMLIVGLINTYIRPRFIARSLGGANLGSVLKGGVLGIPLMLCSCGVVPTALELKRDGASEGAVVSFLTATPQTGLSSIIATYGLLGPLMAVFRPLAAFITGVISGQLTNAYLRRHPVAAPPQLPADEEGCPACHDEDCHCHHHQQHHHELGEEGRKSFKNVFAYPFGPFLDDISLSFVVGIVLAAVLSTFLPYDSLSSYGITTGLPAILLMLVISLPIYVCSISSIPVALTLLASGISPGAAFVFLFAGPATNIASIALIVKQLGKRVTAIFVAGIAVMALLFGLLFEWIYPLLPAFATELIHGGNTHAEHDLGWFSYLLAAVFAVLLLISLIRRARYSWQRRCEKRADAKRHHGHRHEHAAHAGCGEHHEHDGHDKCCCHHEHQPPQH